MVCMVINLPTPAKYNSPLLNLYTNLTPGGQDLNRVNSPDFGWLNVNRYEVYNLVRNL